MANSVLTSFGVVGTAVDEFEQVLKGHGLSIRTGSGLEHACLILKQLDTWRTELLAGAGVRGWAGSVRELREAIGILNLVQLVLRHSNHPAFPQLLPHLVLLNEGQPAQTSKSLVTDDASNKIFELRLALACLDVGRDFDVEDPNASAGGANPDVLCTMPDGRRWGLACKVLHSDNPLTLGDRFLDGVDQIERSPAELGIVVVSMKNLLPHDEVLPVTGHDAEGAPIYGASQDVGVVTHSLSDFATQRVSRMQKERTPEALADRLRGKKALPVVAVPIDTVGLFRIVHGAVLSHLSFLNVVRVDWGIPKRFDDTAQGITAKINDGLVAGR